MNQHHHHPLTTAARQTDLQQAIQRLEEQQAQATTAAANVPERLPLRAIKKVPEAFNVRGTDLDEYHLQQLGRVLTTGGDFPPVLVLVAGGDFVLVDGHHRLEVYRRAGRTDVPVRVFEGSPAEAVLEAVDLAARASLGLTNKQRQDCAWRLVRAGYSISQIMRAACIGRGQVGIMRRVMRTLEADANDIESWDRARRLADGRGQLDLSDEEMEAMLEAHAQRFADRLQRTFHNKLATNPEVAAHAFAIYMGRKLPDFARFLHHHLPEDGGRSYFEDEDSEF